MKDPKEVLKQKYAESISDLKLMFTILAVGIVLFLPSLYYSSLYYYSEPW